MNDDVSIGRIHIVLELNIDQYAPIIIESKKKKMAVHDLCIRWNHLLRGDCNENSVHHEFTNNLGEYEQISWTSFIVTMK